MSDSVSRLIENSQYEEALDTINKILPDIEDRGKKLTYSIQRVDLYERLGNYEKMRAEAEQLIHTVTVDTPEMYIEVRYHLIVSLYRLGDLTNAFDNLRTTLEEIEQLPDLDEKTLDHWIARLNFTYGNLYYYNGDIDEALSQYKYAKQIWNRLGDEQSIAKCNINIGTIHKSKGELDEALAIFDQALENIHKLDNEVYRSFVHNNIGTIYQAKGEMLKALDSHKQSLEIKKRTGSKDSISTSYNNIGMVYVELGEYDKGVDYLRQSLDILRDIGNPLEIVETAFYLIDAYYRHGTDRAIEQAQKIFNEIEPLHHRTENKRLVLFFQLAKVLILRLKPSSRTKVKAMDILEEIIDQEVIDFWVTTLAIEHYTNILLEEYRQYEQPETLTTINELINQLLVYSQDNYSFPLIIKSLILKSNLQLINGNISKSYEMLEQASIICIENNLASLHQMVHEYEDDIKSKLRKWELVMSDSEEIRESVEKEIMTDYIDSVKSIFS